jgi:hypothetical protein
VGHLVPQQAAPCCDPGSLNWLLIGGHLRIRGTGLDRWILLERTQVVGQDLSCRESYPGVLNFVAERVFLLRIQIEIEEPRNAPLLDHARSRIELFALHLPVFPLVTP